MLRQLRPGLVIVHAPELLPLTLLWRALGGVGNFCTIFRKTTRSTCGPSACTAGWCGRRWPAGLRWVESAAARRAAAVLLAEASYANELPFLRPYPPAGCWCSKTSTNPPPAKPYPPLPARCPRVRSRCGCCSRAPFRC
ncbi:MAG: hypothetical protein WKG07_18205 [Hymenobacter sp.]